MTTVKWNDGSSDNWTTATDWDDNLQPPPGSDVIVNQGDPQITSATGNIDIDSLTNSANVTFVDAGAQLITGDLSNSGTVHIDDNGGPGGTSLTVGGTTTNTGAINIGTTNLGVATIFTTGVLNNYLNTNDGTINISGNVANSALGTLYVDSAAGLGAADDIVGSVNLYGDALLEFASGQITTIFGGGELTLDGPDASVEVATTPTTNSALTTLTTISGTLNLWDIAPLTLTGDLTNTGYLDVDSNGGLGGPGGTDLTIDGLLSNGGTLGIGTTNLGADTTVTASGLDDFVGTSLGTINISGNTTGPYLATLDILASAFSGTSGELFGDINLYGDALLEFQSGQVTQIASGSELTLDGASVSVESLATPGTNSAITGLTENDGSLNLWGIGPLALSGALTNTGYLDVDNNGGLGGPGGTTLTINGVLTNSGTLGIGTTNLDVSSTVTAKGLQNKSGLSLGTINISGNTSAVVPTPVSATLDITAAAPSVLSGSVNLTGGAYGHAVLEFASGGIKTIAANSEFTLYGLDAFVELSTAPNSDSALTGLTTIDSSGALHLWDAAPLTLTGGLTNDGYLDVDNNGGLGGPGGSKLTVTNTLTNNGTVGIGTTNLNLASTVTAGGLDNAGTINVSGYTGTNVPTPVSASLIVNSAAGFGTLGVLSGQVNLTGGSRGHALIQFASGGINTIASGAALTLVSQYAFVNSLTGSGNNSALTGLANIIGSLNLGDAAPLTLSGDVNVSGGLNLDSYGAQGGAGGSSVAIAGTLTNSGTISVGTTGMTVDSTVTADDLVNTGTINLYGSASAIGTLAVDDNVNNDGGAVNVYDDSAFTVGGNYTQTAPATLSLQASSTTVYSSLAPAGDVDIAGGQLFFDAYNVSLAAGQTYNLLTFTGGDLQGVYDTLRVDNSTGASTDVNLGNNLTAGLVYDDAAGDIQLQIAATPTTTADSWNGGAGNFGTSADWSNDATRFYSDVTIGATTPGTVTVSNDATIDSLTLDGGSSLTSDSGTDFTIGNGLTMQANATLTIGGESFIDGATSNSGAVTIEGTLLDVRGAVTGSGGFTLGGAGSELEFGNTVAAGETVTFSGADTILKLDDPTGFAATLANIALGDKIDLTGTLLQGTPTVSGDTLSFTDTHNNTYDYTLSGLPSGVDFTTQSDGAGGDYLIAQAACYARGTRILTQRGEIAVEDLRIGDLVVTASGGSRPVRWLGYRSVDVSRHPEPAAVWPVRVCAHAFGEGAPHRDLWLSPGHNVAWEGTLMPIESLINGRSVAQVEVDRAEYWHVELDAHDVIFAEGLAAESYLDTGNRNAFANGGAFVDAHPDFRPRHWADTCLPLALEGPPVVAAKRALLARLAEGGVGVDHEADAHVRVDGARVEPIRLGVARLAFVLPSGGRQIMLRSRTFIPALTLAHTSDPRALGLCVAALQIDGGAVALESVDAGWHEAEHEDGLFQHRWTTGETPLPAGARLVIVDLAGVGHFWAESEGRLTALSA